MSLILLHGTGILLDGQKNSVKDKKTQCQLPDQSLRALSFSREFVKIAHCMTAAPCSGASPVFIIFS
jgi:hypothetical protein